MKERPFDWRKQREQFGQVRPIISADYLGNKVVAVGHTIYADSKWKNFPDFLNAYLRGKFGSEWAKAELAKPLVERHPVLQWIHSIAQQQKTAPRIGGELVAMSSGYSRAYFLLAYDLYTLEHHSALQEWLLTRLRQAPQFQGACYELFVAATFIRAGFTVKHEDEQDTKVKHPEFIAIHERSKLSIDIEAKSKHRDAILGYQKIAVKKRPDKPFAGVLRMLKAAAEKFRQRPYMVFIDLNLPPPVSEEEAAERRAEFQSIAGSSALFENGKSIFTSVGFTNFPDHYDGAAVARCGDSYCILPSLVALNGIPIEHFNAIVTAIQQYGNIPMEFPSR